MTPLRCIGLRFVIPNLFISPLPNPGSPSMRKYARYHPNRDTRGGAPHPWRAARDWARGGAHNNPPPNTTPLSPGRRGAATARGALGWYRPSVGVSRDVGCRALVVYAANLFSVHADIPLVRVAFRQRATNRQHPQPNGSPRGLTSSKLINAWINAQRSTASALDGGRYDGRTTSSARTWMAFVTQRLSVASQLSMALRRRRRPSASRWRPTRVRSEGLGPRHG